MHNQRDKNLTKHTETLEIKGELRAINIWLINWIILMSFKNDD